MKEMFNSNEIYFEFIDKMAVLAETIEYNFTYQFPIRVPNEFELKSFKILSEDTGEETVEIRLFQQIFDNRLSLSMKSATKNDNNYAVKFITIKSILTEKNFDFLKHNGIFYTLENWNDNVSYDYPEFNLNNQNYGHVQLTFFDKHNQRIAFIDCHNGIYDLNDNYADLIDQQETFPQPAKKNYK